MADNMLTCEEGEYQIQDELAESITTTLSRQNSEKNAVVEYFSDNKVESSNSLTDVYYEPMTVENIAKNDQFVHVNTSDTLPLVNGQFNKSVEIESHYEATTKVEKFSLLLDKHNPPANDNDCEIEKIIKEVIDFCILSATLSAKEYEIESKKENQFKKIQQEKNVQQCSEEAHIVTKENHVLKARIAELNDELQNSKKKIESLRKALNIYECDDQMKNPKLMLHQLKSHEEAKIELKTQMRLQSAKLEASEAKQTELMQKIKILQEETTSKIQCITQKQEEIESLESKVEELMSAIQSMVVEQESSGVNGLSVPNAHTDVGANSSDSVNKHSNISIRSRPKVSKICILL